MLVTSPEDFDFLEVGLASSDKIRYWSFGEVEKPETINYRTFKPERKGLFCEKIFGPVKDWECACGKYRRIRYRGIVCERCGVEVTHSKVRRERMGHIELASPVTHIWFLKGIPGYMGLILNLTTRQLEEVVYYDSYMITHVDESLSGQLEVKQLLSPDEYYDLKELHGEKIKAGMGAEAIATILKKIDLNDTINQLREDLVTVKGQKKLKVTKRLKILEAMSASNNRPEWVVLDALPVMPPDLRPMVQLEGGRFATSDLNDLYRRVVNRNNRLKRLLDIGAPEMIVRNEKRMLQEAVDVLIANGKRGRAVTGSNGRPLKSLGNIIEGKQGRFRQNLLGKRVDYSARSVIVVGPHLKFNQCGLPKEMALELFKPFVIQKLVEKGYVSNVKTAKRKIERKDVYVWDVLEDIIKGQPVLLNRAPTLHRLGIQAFDPILVEGSAIQVHPLVCTAFNADFDGDQMAVHVPLSLEAQSECRLLVMSTNNLISPSNGRPIVTPTQDMILGLYFLTVDNPEEERGKGKFFGTVDEAMRAFEAQIIALHSPIKVKVRGELLDTTIGRVIFNNTIYSVLEKNGISDFSYINEVVGKKKISKFILDVYYDLGSDICAEIVNELKTIGFKYATLSGISISVDDMKVPKDKHKILEKAEKEISKLEKVLDSGAVSREEMILRSHEIWRDVTSKVSDKMEDEFGGLNNVFIMANSGARGNIDQVRQLAGMRGLMSDAQGRTVEVPIKSNFKEGLSLAEYFISCYGARKGLVDTALRTADSGYLTRRLVDVAQDVTITVNDCGTKNGINLTAIKENEEEVVSLFDLAEGRVLIETIKDPKTDKVLVKANTLLTYKECDLLRKLNLQSVKVRSIYTCEAKKGICQKCYGLDLSNGSLINLGEAVGIIAAQSIGEPGTQLTMRTFHTGGVDLRKASKVEFKASNSGTISLTDASLGKAIDDEGVERWVTTQKTDYELKTAKGEVLVHTIPQGAFIAIKNKQKVTKGDLIYDYDPSYKFVISQSSGVVKYLDFNVSKSNNKTASTVASTAGELFVFDKKNTSEYFIPKEYSDKLALNSRLKSEYDLAPRVNLKQAGIVGAISKSTKTNTKKQLLYKVVIYHGDAFLVNAGAEILVKDGGNVSENTVISVERMSSEEASKTKDIVQGLPRVEELFEARKYRDNAILSEIEGLVDIYDGASGKIVSITGKNGRKEYKILDGVRILVYSGQKIQVGDQITSGVINPHDLLDTKGVVSAQNYLVEEVLKVYQSQGVQINSKHVEVIVRQMTRKLDITEMGDSDFLPNEVVDIKKFSDVNKQLIDSGKNPAEGNRILLGITRASLNTDSFISASSFQETAKVLSRAAIRGERDEMYGLKENVIIGKLIPAGTGFKSDRFNLVSSDGSELTTSDDLII